MELTEFEKLGTLVRLNTGRLGVKNMNKASEAGLVTLPSHDQPSE
jgi:hypothetical protein